MLYIEVAVKYVTKGLTQYSGIEAIILQKIQPD